MFEWLTFPLANGSIYMHGKPRKRLVKQRSMSSTSGTCCLRIALSLRHWNQSCVKWWWKAHKIIFLHAIFCVVIIDMSLINGPLSIFRVCFPFTIWEKPYVVLWPYSSLCWIARRSVTTNLWYQIALIMALEFILDSFILNKYIWL